MKEILYINYISTDYYEHLLGHNNIFYEDGYLLNNQSLVNMLLIISVKLTFHRKNTSKGATLSIMWLLPIKYQYIIEKIVIEFQLIDLNKLLVAPT